MTSATPRDLVVGVYDEPDLILAGVRAMLGRAGTSMSMSMSVRALPRSRAAGRVDVVLCDPWREPTRIAAYVERVRDLAGAPVVAFGWSSLPYDVRQVLDAGASGFVSKRAGAQELMHALTSACISAPDTPLAPEPASAPVPLSDREAAVLQLICQGLSNDEIADSLFVSVNSVKTWVSQVYRKTGVTRRSQAVAWGVARDY